MLGSFNSITVVNVQPRKATVPEEPEAVYIPLDPAQLNPDRACDFPLYLFHSGRNRYVLFKAQGDPIRCDQLELIAKSGCRFVFVPAEFGLQVQKFLSEGLDALVKNSSMPVEEKTNRFHSLASSVMHNLFDSQPDNREFVETARYVSDSLAVLMVEEPHSIWHLNQLRSYDYYTYSHSMNVCVLSLGLYRQLNSRLTTGQVQDFARGVLLHDIGKCDIPMELTNKRGPLTPSEWIVMRSHTTQGYERLACDTDLSDDARHISLLHHEAIDGSGYPTGKSKDSIPYTSRVCKVVDVFDALTSRRSYKGKMSTFDALRIMASDMKLKIDQELLREFVVFLDRMGKMNVRKVKS